jgi:hypothetical protein
VSSGRIEYLHDSSISIDEVVTRKLQRSAAWPSIALFQTLDIAGQLGISKPFYGKIVRRTPGDQSIRFLRPI